MTQNVRVEVLEWPALSHLRATFAAQSRRHARGERRWRR